MKGYRPHRNGTKRQQDRLVKKEKDEVFSVLVHGFFSDITGKNPKEVMELYKRYERVWMERCKKVNASSKLIFLQKDAFEEAVKIKGHITIKNSRVSNRAKIYALYLLHPVQGHSKFYYAFRDLPIWFKYLFLEFKK